MISLKTHDYITFMELNFFDEFIQDTVFIDTTIIFSSWVTHLNCNPCHFWKAIFIYLSVVIQEGHMAERHTVSF